MFMVWNKLYRWTSFINVMSSNINHLSSYQFFQLLNFYFKIFLSKLSKKKQAFFLIFLFLFFSHGMEYNNLQCISIIHRVLPFNNLTGTIPCSISTFKNLRYLYVPIFTFIIYFASFGDLLAAH